MSEREKVQEPVIRCQDCSGTLMYTETPDGYKVIHSCINGKQVREMFAASHQRGFDDAKDMVCEKLGKTIAEHEEKVDDGGSVNGLLSGLILSIRTLRLAPREDEEHSEQELAQEFVRKNLSALRIDSGDLKVIEGQIETLLRGFSADLWRLHFASRTAPPAHPASPPDAQGGGK